MTEQDIQSTKAIIIKMMPHLMNGPLWPCEKGHYQKINSGILDFGSQPLILGILGFYNRSGFFGESEPRNPLKNTPME